MSEYQYYEFQSVDRYLTDKEMSELRSFSTRANITSNSFVNEYSWGDFKGNVSLWMEKYFDGFLYYANWGTHVLKLGLSAAFLDFKTVQTYCSGDNFSARLSNDKIILDFSSENESYDEWEEGLRLSQFLSLRSDLIRGDLRCLYLGWLAGLQNEDYDEEELEPAVPPGLAQLTPALINFADFLRIDDDLIDAASKTSSSLEDVIPCSNDFRVWLADLSANEKENLLADILEGGMKGDQAALAKLVHRFSKIWQSQDVKIGKLRKQRTVGKLLKEAECIKQTRRQIEAEKAAAKQAEQQRLNKLAREKRLNEITGRESTLWEQTESFASEKKAMSYDKAVELLIDLRDLAARGDAKEFRLKLDGLRKRHSAKSSFIRRLCNLDL